MVESSEEAYLASARKLRASLPKFVIFFGIAYLIWATVTTFFIPLAEGVFIGKVEALKLESLLVLAIILVLIGLSFAEMKNIADASAHLLTFYISSSAPTEIRLEKLRTGLRLLLLILPFTFSYLMFKSLLQQIHPTISLLVPIGVMVWTIVAFILFAMVLGLEIEEAAKAFVERFKRKK